MVDGTAGGASDGILDFSYTSSTGSGKITGDDLHVYDVNGCLGLVATGDPVSVKGSLKLTPKQTITSP